MISVTCDQCGNGHDYAAWLAGMRVQCKGCKAWLDIPRPEGPSPRHQRYQFRPRRRRLRPRNPFRPRHPPPPPPGGSPLRTPRRTKGGIQHRPPGLADAVLVGWLNDVQVAGATPGEMEQELVERGCSPAYAEQFVARFLRGELRRNRSLHAVAEVLSITGHEGLTEEDLRKDLRSGGRFVICHHCYSLLVLSVKQPTGIQYVRSIESRFRLGLPYTLRSLLLGWWGGWGPIFTLQCLVTSSAGGTDVTAKVLDSLGWRDLHFGR